MPEDWMKSDNVNGIDPLKLQMLNSIASQGSQKGDRKSTRLNSSH